jgi:cobalt-zinc-cadmium efflux system protein
LAQHSDHNHHHHQASGRIGLVFALNFGFTILEIIGGIWTNSVAIIADAVHDLGDTFSLGISWYLERYARRSGDEVFSFGYQRFSLLGALVTSTVLLLGSVFVLSESIPRLFAPEPANAQGMLLLAVIGLAVNGAAALRMRHGRTLNERMVTWHLVEDVLGWAAVLVVSIVLLFWDIYILDSLLSIAITVFVLWNVFRALKETLVIFLQGVPSSVSREGIEAEIVSVEGVAAVHHTHMWSLDGDRHVFTAHVVVEASPSLAQMDGLRAVIKKRLSGLGIAHATLEMEHDEGQCSDDA